MIPPDSRQVYVDGWLTIREDTLRLSDGSTGSYTVVDSADSVLIVPVDGDLLHVVEQYRHPVGGRRWEFPSGSVEEQDADGTFTDGKSLAAYALLLTSGR